MKIKALVLGVMLASAAFAGQDSVSLAHKYKVGDKDLYTMSMKLELAAGEITVAGEMTQTVLKVYENGDADLETKTGELTVNAMGQENKVPATPATTQKVNKFGQPMEAPKGQDMAPFLMLGGLFGDGNLKVGETKTIDQSTPSDEKSKVKGTIKVDSVTDGVAKLISSLDVSSPKAPKPLHFDTTTWVSTDSGRVQKLEGKASGMDDGGGQGIKGMSFTMALKK